MAYLIHRSGSIGYSLTYKKKVLGLHLALLTKLNFVWVKMDNLKFKNSRVNF